MTRDTRLSTALHQFVNGCDTPPFTTIVRDYGRAPKTFTVLPVTCKTGYAAARNIMLRHSVISAAAIVTGERIIYAARWLCPPGLGTIDAVFVPADSDLARCQRCEVFAQPDGPGVYRIIGTDGTLLYIGSAEHALRRVHQHKMSKRWRDSGVDFQITPYPTVIDARMAEVSAIATEHPRLNVLHSRRRAA